MTSRLTRREFCELTAAAGVTMVSSAGVVAAADGRAAGGHARFQRALRDAEGLADGVAKKGRP